MAVALGGTPEGFRESARLTPIASDVSGKPVFVRCATSEATWEAFLRPWDLPPRIQGLTFPDNDGTYLKPTVCRALEGWLRGRSAPSVETLGVMALVLAHEAVHTRGVDDESVTDCTALRELPSVLRRWFAVRRQAALRVAMNAAWAAHRSRPPVFRTVC